MNCVKIEFARNRFLCPSHGTHFEFDVTNNWASNVPLVINLPHHLRARSGTISGQSIGLEMKSRNCSLFAFALGAIIALTTSSLSAQTRVGEAAVIRNEVLRVAGSATSRVNVGDGLLRNEIVRTGLDSAARLVMSDSTNLSLGPNASLR
jgi:hypothetical protein